MCRKHAWVGLGLLVLAGCFAPVRPDVDALICGSAGRPFDPQPAAMPDSDLLPTPKLLPDKNSTKSPAHDRPDASFDNLLRIGTQNKSDTNQPPGKGPSLLERLEVPPDLEGGKTPRIVMPDPKDKKVDPKLIEKAVQKYFPPLPDIGPDPQPGPGPQGKPLTLADLQQLAMANSPLLREAAANVSAARGTMIQAGLYPNPSITLSGSTNGPSGGPLFGPSISQPITTMGKLKLAQATAEMDLRNAELAYRRAETDLMASVRTGYFSVLVAEENIRQNRALVKLTDELYKVMVQQLKGGELATYEPMQVGVFSAQARASLITARNNYTLAWKQLTAAMGLPGMPPTELVGRIKDLPIPQYRFDTVLAHVLSNHTDVGTALNAIAKARYNLRLAEVTPIPDVTVTAGLTNDETQPGPNRVSTQFSVSVPVPIWNLNQGAVMAAKSLLMSANEEPHRVRDDLTGRVADAYRRYNENFDLLGLYHKEILPKQVQAYRSAVQRHYGGEPAGVAFNDLITAEQNLVSVIGAYLTVLQAQWQAVADLGSLLQTNDIFQLAEGHRFAEVPDLSKLLPLPCCHPCNPLPNDAFKGADLHWLQAGFGLPAAGLVGPPVPTEEKKTPQAENPVPLVPPDALGRSLNGLPPAQAPVYLPDYKH